MLNIAETIDVALFPWIVARRPTLDEIERLHLGPGSLMRCDPLAEVRFVQVHGLAWVRGLVAVEGA